MMLKTLKSRFISLKYKITIPFSFFVFIAALVIIFLFYGILRQSFFNNATNSLRDFTDIYSNIIINVLQDSYTDVNSIEEFILLNFSKDIELNNHDIREINLFASNFEFFKGIALTNTNGKEILLFPELSFNYTDVEYQEILGREISSFVKCPNTNAIECIIYKTKIGNNFTLYLIENTKAALDMHLAAYSNSSISHFLIDKFGTKISQEQIPPVAIPIENCMQFFETRSFLSTTNTISYFGMGESPGVNGSLYYYQYVKGVDKCLVTFISIENVLATFYPLFTLFVLVILALFLFLSALSFLLGEIITRPIIKLSDIAKEIKAGNIEFPIAVDTNDEVEVLATTLKEVTLKLQGFYGNLHQQIKEKTKEIEEKLLNIEKNNIELEKSKKAVMNILDDVEKNNIELQKTKDALTKALEEARFEREKAEKEAVELKKFQQAVESFNDQIVITDSEGIILFANKALEKITGFSVKESLGQKAGNKNLWGGLMAPEFYKNLWKTIKVDKKSFTGEILNKRKNGERYSTLATISPILNKNKEIVAFVATEKDITETKKKEEALAKLALIVENSNEAIVSLSLDKKILSWNNGATQIFGFSEKEVIGKNSDKIISDSEIENENWQNVIENKSVYEFKTSKTRKDGTTVDVSIDYFPIQDQKGNVTGIGVIIRDITIANQIDKAKTEFVSLASHQLRTPLSAIKWYAEMLHDANLNKDQEELLKQINESNTRMIALVNSLLNVSRIDLGTFEINPEPTKVFLLCDSVINEMKQDISKKKIVIEKKYDTDELIVNLDPDLARIIFQNLLSNAVKYSPEKSKITITIKKTANDLYISVKDSGYGIPEHQKHKVFLKLFRADNVIEKDVEGTGLGLYIVKSIVEQSKGKIWFESELNKGSTFYVTLPLAGMLRKKGSRKLTVK